MKKLITLLLVVVMCLTLAACTNDKEIKALNEKIDSLEAQLDNDAKIEALNKKVESLEAQLASQGSNNNDIVDANIVGTWAFGDSGYNAGGKLTFKEDGTFNFTMLQHAISGTWTYLPEIKTAMLVAKGQVEFVIFEEKDGVLKINLDGEYAEKEN